MPHALFLGSSLGTLDRVSAAPTLPGSREPRVSRLQAAKTYLRSLFYMGSISPGEVQVDRVTRHEFRQNNSYSFVKAHMNHGMVDISTYRNLVFRLVCLPSIWKVLSLLGFAVPINSAYAESILFS